MKRFLRSGASLALVALLVAACGGSSSPSTNPNAAEHNPPGDIPDNQVFVRFKSPSGHFTVNVPEGWARTGTNGTVIFTDKLNSVAISSHATPSAPTVQSATATEVPEIASSAPNYKAGSVTMVQRPAGPAVLVTYQADSRKDPVTGKIVRDAIERYEFYKDGTEAILTLSGPVGADNIDPWRIVTDSFRWTG